MGPLQSIGKTYPTKKTVTTVPVDKYGTPISAIDTAVPRSSTGPAASYGSERLISMGADPASAYYDPSILAYYDNPGAPPMPSSPSTGTLYSGAMGISMAPSYTQPIPPYDPSKPYADYSGVDWSIADPGMGGLSGIPVGTQPAPAGGGLQSLLPPRQWFDGPKAQANPTYRAAAKSTASLMSTSRKSKGTQGGGNR